MMNNELLHEANEVLGDLKRRHKRMTQQLDKLKRFEGWVLREGSRKGNGRIYYDAILPGSGKKIYLGGEKHEQVLNVKRYRYARKAIEVLENDIKLLNILIKGYVHTDYETINSLLPSAYQTNLKEPGIPGSNMPKEAIEWKRQLEAEKAKYPPYKPEELKHPAMDGMNSNT